jgi:hypothetical protein
MSTMNCPKCDADISESYEPDDWSCGIVEGWYCDACDLAVAGWERPREPLEGDVFPLPSAPTEPLGTPISKISGRPSEKGYAEFVRIAKSWGFD